MSKVGDTPIHHLHAKEWLTADTDWLRNSAQRIDQQAGNSDGRLNGGEIDRFVDAQQQVASNPEQYGTTAAQQAEVQIANARDVAESLRRAEEIPPVVRTTKNAVRKVSADLFHGFVSTMEYLGAALGLIKPL